MDTILEIAKSICDRLQEAGHQAYFVGGAVRDQLFGITPEEYDIATSATPQEVAALFAKTIPIGVKFGIIMVVEEHVPFQIATFRAEAGYNDGRHPDVVRFSDAKEDVIRRDFTINGLLQDHRNGEIIDHVGGIKDIERGIIRTIGDPHKRFGEDFLRMLRAARFSARLRFDIEEETFKAITKNCHKILEISAERLREEMTKMLTGGAARRSFEILHQTGLLGEIIPELLELRGCQQPPRHHPEGDVWEHTMRVLEEVDKVEVPPELAWAGLLHDIGKPQTLSRDERGIHFYEHHEAGAVIAESIAVRFKFSTVERKLIKELVKEHMRFINVQEMRPAKLKKFLCGDNFFMLLDLCRWDALASDGDLANYEFCKKKREEMRSEDLHPPKLIDGNDLLRIGAMQGRGMAEILEIVKDAQLEGSITSREEAIMLAKKIIGAKSE